MFWTGIGSFGLILVIVLYLTAGNKTLALFWFCLVIGLLIALGSLLLEFNRKYKKSIKLVAMMQNLLDHLEEFSATKQFISPDQESMIAIDEVQKKLLIVFNKNEHEQKPFKIFTVYRYEYRIFSFHDLLQSEILENNRPLRKTPRNQSNAPPLVIDAKSKIERQSSARILNEKIKTMELKIIVDDTIHPSYSINLLPLQTTVYKNSKTYMNAKAEAISWHELLGKIIK